MAERSKKRQKVQKTVESMQYVLDNKKDAFFEVGPPGGPTVIIWVHKKILMACSDYFDTMFSIGMSECVSEPHKAIRVEDIDAAIFKDLLL